jgi:hypothetical protein
LLAEARNYLDQFPRTFLMDIYLKAQNFQTREGYTSTPRLANNSNA